MKTDPVWSAWVDPLRRIVSFTPRQGFRRRDFPSHREMFLYVIGLGREGYAII